MVIINDKGPKYRVMPLSGSSRSGLPCVPHYVTWWPHVWPLTSHFPLFQLCSVPSMPINIGYVSLTPLHNMSRHSIQCYLRGAFARHVISYPSVKLANMNIRCYSLQQYLKSNDSSCVCESAPAVSCHVVSSVFDLATQRSSRLLHVLISAHQATCALHCSALPNAQQTNHISR